MAFLNAAGLRRANAARTALVLVSVLLVVAASVFKIRLSDPVITPDSLLFVKIADNIRQHGCFSASDPKTHECSPSWGSQPPGYPIVLAAVRTVGSNPRLVIALQVALFTCAALWLASAFPYTSYLQVFGRALLLIASPLTLAWGRWMLTETLAMATTMCAFAVFAKALHARTVNLPALATALVVAMLIRWDQVWLVLPACVLIGVLYPWREATRRILILGIAVSIPYSALVVRAVLRGLPPIPGNTVDLDLPPNVLRFWRIAALDQRATMGLIWPSWSHEYAKVTDLDLRGFSGAVPRADLTELISRLSRTDKDADFPADVDQGFGRLATRLVSEHRVLVRIGVPVTRAARIWTSPDQRIFSGWVGVGQWAESWEGWRTVYRVTLLSICVLAVFSRLSQPLRRLSILLVLYIVGRTAFLVSPSLTMLETRYLVEPIPIMELTALLVVTSHVRRLIGLHADRVHASRSPAAIG